MTSSSATASSPPAVNPEHCHYAGDPEARSLPTSAAAAYYKLRDGHSLPALGFGTYRVEPGSETYDAVSAALKLGYRHVDTAALYGNEEDVGKAVGDFGIQLQARALSGGLF